ncbi:transcription termination/antitermination NusG family protein [Ensifer sp. 1H6]|uniref:transcription termination/antitermination protein NusG n=1 Tax=Ensifer sp. 1H6 TaxID=1911585 RepID=UPI0009C4DBFB|nr:transcription termination/antitermination NusG family protein [Ensifer sp. 1H6]OMQ44939.1 hypothetical protein BKP54_11140 [Ensifer sp. 1H6]
MIMQRRVYEGVPVIIDDARVDPARMAKAWAKDEWRTIRASMLSMASANQLGEKGWYVLQTFAGCEKGVERALAEKGVMAYLPLVPGGKRVVRGRAIQCADKPAMAGYVMVCVVPSAAAFAGLVRVRNVECIVGGAEAPHRVSDETMRRFKIMLGEFSEAEAHAQEFAVKDWVRFEEGPFTGFSGRITKIRKMVPVRGMKPIAVEGRVDVEIGGKVTSITTPLAFLGKL